MVKKYSKQLNSLSNTKTKRGGAFGMPNMGLMSKAKDADLKEVIKAIELLKTNLIKLPNLPTLREIHDLAILKNFNKAFIKYLRIKLRQGQDGFRDYKILFDKNSGNIVENNDKINHILYSKFINGLDLNSNKLPTNQQKQSFRKYLNNKNKNAACPFGVATLGKLVPVLIAIANFSKCALSIIPLLKALSTSPIYTVATKTLSLIADKNPFAT